MTIDEITQLFKTELVEKQLPLKLFTVEEKEDYFLVTVWGVNNGHHDWPQYLRTAALVMEGLYWWLVDSIDVCPLHVHNVVIGVTYGHLKGQL